MLSSHILRVEPGRHTGLQLNERICILCNTNAIEDHYYFILICPIDIVLRRKYIKPFYYTRPSVNKFILLLNNTNYKILYNLSLYCKHAFNSRLDVVNRSYK